MTVWALLTAMAVSEPVEKFITSMAPRKEKPLTVAVGTAAYPVGSAVGNTMLVVGPGRRTFPKAASVVVLTAYTLLLLASKAAAMFRVGDIAIRPGEFPALRGVTRAIVSFDPLIKSRLPEVSVALTPCETKTRSFRPLGGFVAFL